MIKVGFIGAVSKEWMGGLNYFKNLLFAISKLENKEIKPVVFIGKKTDKKIKNMFNQYATVVEHRVFDRKSIDWFIWKVGYKLFGKHFIFEKLLQKHGIKVLSHASIIGLKSIKTINWIPDFQHIHLKEMFSAKEIKHRNIYFLDLIKYSNAIVLSSFDALKDFKVFAPNYVSKTKILRFVSQPNDQYFSLTKNDEQKILKKYNINSNFFYIPNQFWKHKNHNLVLKAVKILKDKNIDVFIVCTGFMHDYRNKTYLETLQNYINKNNLTSNIKFLGLVDYADVFALIKFSKAVINPSLFEGWSSTVEECKSVGKSMILSDLDVHIEQYPSATFFEKNNADSLANVLENFDKLIINKPLNYVADLSKRTDEFAQTYQEIILNSV